MAPIREFITRWGFDVDLSELKKMETRTKKIRSGFLKMGAAATAALTGIVAPAATLDDTLRRSAAAAGVTGKQFDGMLDRLRSQTMDVAEDLGISGKRIAAGFFDVISAGVTPASEHFESFSNAGFRLSKVMGGDVGPAVERLKTTLNAFQKGVGEATNVSDVFVKANTLGQTSIEQLSEAMGLAGPIAFQAGRDLEETTALLIGLAEGSFRGVRGGEGLKQIMLALGAPTDRAKAKLQELRIELTDDEGNFLSFIKIIEQFETRLKGMSESQRLVAVEQIVGREAAAKFLALMGQGSEQIAEWETKLRNADGATELYIKQMAGFLDIGRRLIQAVKNLAITMGTPLLGPLQKISEIFLEGAKSIRQFMATHPQLTDGLSKIAGAVLGIVILGSAFGTLTTTVTLARIAIARMGTEALLANAKALALPILLIAIGLLLFALFDDLAAAMAGNESVLGDLIDKFHDWRFEIQSAAAVFAGLGLAIGLAFAPVTLLLALLGVLAAVIIRNTDAYREFWELNKGTDWRTLAGEFGDWVAQWELWESVLTNTTKAVEKLFGLFKGGSVRAFESVRDAMFSLVGVETPQPAGPVGATLSEFLTTPGEMLFPGTVGLPPTPGTTPVPPAIPLSEPANVSVRTGDVNIEGVGRDEILSTVWEQQQQQFRELESELE